MITVVIPVLNESVRIASVIALAFRHSGVSEVIVVDDGSIDNTIEIAAATGAKVIASSLLGKGASMEDGLKIAKNDIIVYLDGDLAGLRDDLIEVLVQPLLHSEADFVKAKFSRKAGRVTTLTAKPLLHLFFPELAQFAQPLGGIIAAKRSLLQTLNFDTDYGVDLGLLIDAHIQGAKIVEVDIGNLDHDSQSLQALGEMSKQVVRSLLKRADRHGRFSIDQITDAEEGERQARYHADAPHFPNTQKLAIFDMDGTLLRGRFVVELAKSCGKERELAKWLDDGSCEPEKRSARIAGLFEGLSKTHFEDVARSIELTDSAVETVVTLRKQGFAVGIVTDSYKLAAEIVRRRVFADFTVANLMHFRSGLSLGEHTVSPLYQHPSGCQVHPYCKQNAVAHLVERYNFTSGQLLCVGDGLNDVCMLRNAPVSVAFEPKDDRVAAAAQHVIHGSLSPVLSILAEKGWLSEISNA